MATHIIRRSIHAFFQSYHSFASIATLFVFPVSASLLLSQALVTSSSVILPSISSRLESLFQAAGFPATQFFSLVRLKISQTIFSFTLTLPFTVTFLLLAKASIIEVIREFPSRSHAPPPFSSFLHLYRSLLPTHLFNSLVILSANATIFSLLFLVFNAVDVIGFSSSNSLLFLSAAAAVLYSVIVANATVICNLAIIVSAMENSSGCLPVLKACMLIRGRVMTALTLALPPNLGMAAIEALFHYRVVRPYHLSKFSLSVIWEAFSITYMHSLVIILEIIMSCAFFRSCKLECHTNLENKSYYKTELEPEEKGAPQV
ncbi:uncharacterized protein LOC103700923 [Phoenix dactylifera]|uniref:Uncharacterized protein LOC103700923 n=1 Tax=Phoenix dactylifera TaxID=42345 RepID=A0A8B7BLJ9_PHODC|nr:uncharacterized protein LOC103700923 [Phoenix dactylifera]